MVFQNSTPVESVNCPEGSTWEAWSSLRQSAMDAEPAFMKPPVAPIQKIPVTIPVPQQRGDSRSGSPRLPSGAPPRAPPPLPHRPASPNPDNVIRLPTAELAVVTDGKLGPVLSSRSSLGEPFHDLLQQLADSHERAVAKARGQNWREMEELRRANRVLLGELHGVNSQHDMPPEVVPSLPGEKGHVRLGGAGPLPMTAGLSDAVSTPPSLSPPATPPLSPTPPPAPSPTPTSSRRSPQSTPPSLFLRQHTNDLGAQPKAIAFPSNTFGRRRTCGLEVLKPNREEEDSNRKQKVASRLRSSVSDLEAILRPLKQGSSNWLQVPSRRSEIVHNADTLQGGTSSRASSPQTQQPSKSFFRKTSTVQSDKELEEKKQRASPQEGTSKFRRQHVVSLTQEFTEHEKEMKQYARRSSGPTSSSHLTKSKSEKSGEADERSCLAKIVQSTQFRVTSALLIISNALLLGVQVEIAAWRKVQPDDLGFFKVAQAVYCVLFTLELAARIKVDGAQFFKGSERTWNCLDLFVVAISILEVSVDTFTIGVGDDSDGDSLRSLSIVRLVRIVRILRLVRIIRVITFFKSLRILIRSIFSTLRSLIWAAILVFMIMYMFAVAFTQGSLDQIHGAGGSPAADELDLYFGNLSTSILTLFQAMCGGVDWGQVLDPLSTLSWFYSLIFLAFITFVYFAVMNVVTGVFCQNAMESAARDQDEVVAEQVSRKNYYVNQLKGCFDGMDQDGQMHITLEGFERSLAEGRMTAFFAMLDIDVADAWEIFKLLDRDQSSAVNLDAFVSGCLQLQGQAKNVDIAKLGYETRWMMNKLSESMQGILQQITVVLEDATGDGAEGRTQSRTQSRTNSDQRFKPKGDSPTAQACFTPDFSRSTSPAFSGTQDNAAVERKVLE